MPRKHSRFVLVTHYGERQVVGSGAQPRDPPSLACGALVSSEMKLNRLPNFAFNRHEGPRALGHKPNARRAPAGLLVSHAGGEGDVSGWWQSWSTTVHGGLLKLAPRIGPSTSAALTALENTCMWFFSTEWKMDISWFKCWERVHVSAELCRGHTKHICVLTGFWLLVYSPQARPGHPLLLLAPKEGRAWGGGSHRDDLFPFRAQGPFPGLQEGKNPRVLQVPE